MLLVASNKLSYYYPALSGVYLLLTADFFFMAITGHRAANAMAALFLFFIQIQACCRYRYCQYQYDHYVCHYGIHEYGLRVSVS